MHGIYKVEEMLCEELEKIGEKDELTAGSLETADKLSHALKNVQKIIDYYEEMGEDEGYSNAGGQGGGDMGARTVVALMREAVAGIDGHTTTAWEAVTQEAVAETPTETAWADIPAVAVDTPVRAATAEKTAWKT